VIGSDSAATAQSLACGSLDCEREPATLREPSVPKMPTMTPLMSLPLSNKFAAALLMLTVLVAQQLCVCANAMVTPPARVSTAAAATHDCCAPKPKAAERSGSHEPSCPHCGEARAKAGTVEAAAKVDLAPRAVVAIVLAPMPNLLSSLLLPAASHAASVAPHAAGPPPDVLRVTGILLI
jgi:hypothetical protein